MNERRLDELLDQLLESGELPADATPSERSELLRLAETAGVLRAAADEGRAEGVASAPAARARFERYRTSVAIRAPVAGSSPPKRPARQWLTVGSLAAAAVLALAIIAALQPFGRRTDSAEAIEAGDFVQLEGTVHSTAPHDSGQLLTLTTAAGELEVVVSPDTAVSDGGDPGEASALRPGQGVVFAGVARSDGQLLASTVTTTRDPQSGEYRPFERLDNPREPFAGVVRLFSLSDERARAVLLLELDDGRRVLLPVRPADVRRLAAERPEVVGARIVVEPGRNGGFSVALDDAAAPQPNHFATLTGTVGDIDRLTMTLDTPDGPVAVRLHRDTRVILSSGTEPLRRLRALRLLDGREVSVQGAHLRDGSLAADLIVVVP